MTQAQPHQSNKTAGAAVAVTFSIFGLVLRLMKLHKHTLWVDEKWQLAPMRGSFLDLLRALPEREFCSYLSGDYYLIYPFYKLFGSNKWALALPHILFTLAGFYFLYRVCEPYLKTWWGYAVTFGLVCFNATMIFHATEIRTYATLPTLALACFYYSRQIAEGFEAMTLRKTCGIGLFFVIVIWWHVYGILMLMLSLVFHLWKNQKRFVWTGKNLRLFGWLILIFAAALPLWGYCVLGPHFAYNKLHYETFEYIANPLLQPFAFFKSVFANLVGRKALYFLLAGMVFPFILPYKSRYEQMVLLGLFVIIPIQLILISVIRSEYWFLQRQFIWTMPFFALYLGWSWESAVSFIISRK